MMLLTGLTHILNREQEKQKTVGKKNVTIESIDRFNSRFILKNIYIYVFQFILDITDNFVVSQGRRCYKQ